MLLACAAASAHAGDSPSHGPEASSRPVIAIADVAIVDVARGRIVPSRTVLIAGGLIDAIGPADALPVPAGALHVAGDGLYLIPGLVDTHVHLFNNASHRPPNDWAFALLVANGVTGVREMYTTPDEMTLIDVWRARVAAGTLAAPRVLAAGVAVGRGPLRAIPGQVQAAHAAGADFLKIDSEVQAPQWRAVLEAARELGMPVSGHVPAEVRALDAARAGQVSDEHLTQLYEACSSQEDAFIDTRAGKSGDAIVALRDAQESDVLRSFDADDCARTAAALARTTQVQVPTLVLPYFEAQPHTASYREDPRWRYLRADEQARWVRILEARRQAPDARAPMRWAVSERIVRTLHTAGVRLLAGTDTPMPLVYPGYALHYELALLVQAGMSPAEALRAATLWPAEFLGISATSGSVEVGKRANLVLLDANPLTDIGHTQRIRAVILDGRWLGRDRLDALLDAAAGGTYSN
jgi:imidazolonepropionase-like amidohydrolase